MVKRIITLTVCLVLLFVFVGSAQALESDANGKTFMLCKEKQEIENEELESIQRDLIRQSNQNLASLLDRVGVEPCFDHILVSSSDTIMNNSSLIEDSLFKPVVINSYTIDYISPCSTTRYSIDGADITYNGIVVTVWLKVTANYMIYDDFPCYRLTQVDYYWESERPYSSPFGDGGGVESVDYYNYQWGSCPYGQGYALTVDDDSVFWLDPTTLGSSKVFNYNHSRWAQLSEFEIGGAIGAMGRFYVIFDGGGADSFPLRAGWGALPN